MRVKTINLPERVMARILQQTPSLPENGEIGYWEQHGSYVEGATIVEYSVHDAHGSRSSTRYVLRGQAALREAAGRGNQKAAALLRAAAYVEDLSYKLTRLREYEKKADSEYWQKCRQDFLATLTSKEKEIAATHSHNLCCE